VQSTSLHLSLFRQNAWHSVTTEHFSTLHGITFSRLLHPYGYEWACVWSGMTDELEDRREFPADVREFD
jgi:hypothetical protein